MRRRSGILLPVFSLGGGRGTGTFGAEAYTLIDFLSESGVKAWQVLPLCPTDPSGSPYSSPCGNCIDPRYIDLAPLAEEGLISESDLRSVPDPERVDYSDRTKLEVLKKAYRSYGGEVSGNLDYALFMAIKEARNNSPWYEWGIEPHSVRAEEFLREHRSEVGFWQFVQLVARKQWNRIRAYAKIKDVEIIGDIPFYVSHDSVEVWLNRDSFDLDGDRPRLVAGVPPDYFSKTGQLWGNPVYAFRKKSARKLWNKRISDAFSLYDRVRLDHFRAFDEYYAVKSGSENAAKGKWYKGPGVTFFRDKMDYAIIAEDLGIVTDSVRRLLTKTGYPGMRVLQFAFDGNTQNPHLPSNIPTNSVCYTGTHDNMSLMQYVKSMDDHQKAILSKVLSDVGEKMPNTTEDTAEAIIELGFASDAELFVSPLADFMYLGAEKRINTPGTVSPENWSMRIREDYTYLKDDLRFLIKKYNR